MKYFNLITVMLIIVGIATMGFAGNDPSIKGQMRAGIQAAESFTPTFCTEAPEADSVD